MKAHAEDLRAEVQDDELIAAISTDYKTADLPEFERAMLDFASKLTLTPQSMTQDDVEALRQVGMEDRTISHIAQVTALFAYYNRVADGLGIEMEDHWG